MLGFDGVFFWMILFNVGILLPCLSAVESATFIDDYGLLLLRFLHENGNCLLPDTECFLASCNFTDCLNGYGFISPINVT